jgi:hypothetical protein
MNLYIALKRFLLLRGARIIGGQPPSGTDHLPVIEIKSSPAATQSGSLDSFKPDLVVSEGNLMFVIEIKPRFSLGDARKLQELMQSEARQKAFWAELSQRNIKNESGAPIDPSQYSIQPALANGGPVQSRGDIWQFVRADDGFMVIDPRGWGKKS